GGVADFQSVFHGEAAVDLARDDRLLRPDVPVPTAGYRQVQTAAQLAVAVHFAADDEGAGAANVPDDDGLGADEGRGRRIAFEEPALGGVAHTTFFILSGVAADVT